ncbi:MAG: hypothetical protein AABW50_03215 [Nanoarchaeota archaeon]
MKKRGLFLLLALLLLPAISSSSVDSEIQKITHYAEEYETGNINYAQLVLQIGSTRQNLNQLLGVENMEEGGLLKQDQIKEVLGEPIRETKWVWVEKEEREKKIDSPAPIWEKVIFDGRKIQIRLNAFPSIFNEISQEARERIRELEGEGNFDEAEKLRKQGSGEDTLVYRLNFQIDFKRPDQQLDIKSKIEDIKYLAETFNADSSSSNAESLAKASVNVEKLFWNSFKQDNKECRAYMTDLFGSENLRQTMNTIANEIIFYEGENFEAKIRLEMCDDCEWNWINMNMWIEGRGPGFKTPKGISNFQESPDNFKGMSEESYKSETEKLISDIKSSLESGNYGQSMSYQNKLMMLTNAWNEQANDVWKQLDVEFQSKTSSMTEEQRNEYYSNYGWLKDEQEKRKKAAELRKQNYERRKAFYLGIFSGYEKKEFYYEQEEFEKRLVEEFKERGEEICNNNVDDNQNEQVDCSDSQCGGKICGKQTKAIAEGNITKEASVDLYCIAGSCQEREEIVVERNESVCGNHICEEGEFSSANLSQGLLCPEDCSICPQYEPIECSGKIIFSGKDLNGCPLEPICLNETESCISDEDCLDPLCGDSSCVEGACQVVSLEECREPECVDGQERIIHCQEQDLFAGICVGGLWQETGLECQEPIEIQEEVAEEGVEREVKGEIFEEAVVGNECEAVSDCGNSNDVCSNGRCVTLPQIVEEEIREEQQAEREVQEENEEFPIEEQPQNDQEIVEEEQETEESGAQPEETPATGSVIFGLFRNIMKSTGSIITGFDTEGGAQDSSGSSGSQDLQESSGGSSQDSPQGDTSQQGDTFQQESGNTEGQNQDQNFEENRQEDNWDERQDDQEDRERDDQRRRENECNDRCERECYDIEIRPCVEECIFEKCGQNFDCNVDETKTNCESSCKSEVDINSCVDNCDEKCMKGEQTWKEPEREEHKEEKGVFTVGGGCKTSQGNTEAFMWFGGWGDPFERIQPLKNKYYQGGDSDWCKWDLENLEKQRKEFEDSFNQEFINWFFEKYLSSSAEDWEQHVSGLFELYWKDVDISRETAFKMNCLEENKIPEYNLIGPVTYESDYGKLEFWEELQVAELPEIGEVTLVTPYMKLWILPSENVIKHEMKKAAKEHRFPGSKDNEVKSNGLTEEEKRMIRQDKGFMEKINELAGKYGGSFDGAVQIVDFETNEVVYNMYVSINEQDIMSLSPMPVEELPETDTIIQADFDIIYDIILTEEKEMNGERIESPPWARQGIKPAQKVKEITNGVEMYFKMRKLMSSARITPGSTEGDAKEMFKEAMKRMTGDERGGEEDMKNQEGFEGEDNNQENNFEDGDKEESRDERGITGNFVG